ncbi:DUF3993 domain-containing protein [Peribacillus deserti]|uniref:DUF3993 domain-containing protein n=1 Tax=Peribacillus deserti TaxID=673318 RepID=A0A2N5M0V9_9BACI|nr:DUF3993 domain-containing protein [Peribacillus deserti]PLT28014.1 hypothetical protein CUU66_20720 [Peribacillus deserti]
MKKTLFSLIASMSLILAAGGASAHAEQPAETKPSSIHKNTIIDLLNDAFTAQVSLSNGGQSLEEVKNKLEPFFTDEFIGKFIDQNIVKVNGQYQTLGSDSAVYYIPFFSYDDKTEVNQGDKENTIVVKEHFNPSSGGPSIYGEHDESVLLIKDGQEWKISEITNTLSPEDGDAESASSAEPEDGIVPEAAVNSLSEIEMQAEAAISAALAAADSEPETHVEENPAVQTKLDSEDLTHPLSSLGVQMPIELIPETEETTLGFSHFFSGGYNLIMGLLNKSQADEL